MGGINEMHQFNDVVNAINNWERHSINNTDIDGPLSVFAKTSLIKTVADLLADYVKSGHDAPQERRGPGRPRRSI